ncbi:hypothetical protein BJ508DRAFT_171762 [Ascobolus immersus RN42]|uniref:Uncharacterized protein n=1 Tax=Ascobolus immersus RN42 TaxID=1160509 RepID=A0A3N4HXT4_ASCIM|nr:hypothetical protein BJ508DRAFT_171762 [Ascobolus immersus RN42]
MPRPSKQQRHMAHVRAMRTQRRLEQALNPPSPPPEPDQDAEPWFLEENFLETQPAGIFDQPPEILERSQRKRTKVIPSLPPIPKGMTMGSTKRVGRRQKKHLLHMRECAARRREERKLGIERPGDDEEEEMVGDAEEEGMSKVVLMGLIEEALQRESGIPELGGASVGLGQVDHDFGARTAMDEAGIQGSSTGVVQEEDDLDAEGGGDVILEEAGLPENHMGLGDGERIVRQNPQLQAFGLKRWNPKTDGKHLPGLKGRAGTRTGDSKRNQQRKRVG